MTDELTVKKALDAISRRKNGAKALEVLYIITYFAPENIHAEMLASLVVDGKELGSAVQLLIQHSIVYLSRTQTVMNLDKTFQKIMITILDKHKKKLQFLEKALELASRKGVISTNLDHALSAWSHIHPYPELIEKFNRLPSHILTEFIRQLRFKEAINFGWKALDLLNKTIGEDHRATLNLQHNIGILLGMDDKHKKALEVLVPLYKKNEKNSVGEEIRVTLISMAKELGDLSRFKEALKIYQQTLFPNEKVSEANDELTLSAWHDYAFTLCELERYSEASEILREIMKRRSQIFDVEESDTLSWESSLAHVLVKEGRYSEALEIFQQVFEGRKAILGENHVNTLRSKRDIALVLAHQGKSDEALAIYEGVVENFKHVLGTEHPDTLTIQAAIAVLFEQRGEFQKALETYNDIYQKQSKILGEKHADPLRVKYHIATILLIQDRHDEGLRTLQEVFETYTEVFGLKHPRTLELKNTLESLNNVYLETIYSAAREGSLHKITTMIQGGADINGTDFYRKTPLHYAAEYGHTSVVKFLLEQGAIYNTKSSKGKTPLQSTDNTEIKNLLNSVAKLIKDVKEGNYEEASVQIEKKNGIVNAKDNDGSNSLHWAAHNGHQDIVKLLLKGGADATQVTNKGNTPLHIATSKGHKGIIEILLESISQDELNNLINAKTTIGGVTSIHVAVKNGSLDIVKSLMKHGAIYNIKNKQGKTPLELSKDKKLTNLLKLCDELFKDATNGNHEIISKLRDVEPDELEALTNTRNDQGDTLVQVLVTNKHENIASKLSEFLKKSDQSKTRSGFKSTLDHLNRLKKAAELHITSSEMYLAKLRRISESCDSEKNPSPWVTLKEGSYYLRYAFRLVEEYQEFTPGSIDDENIQSVNAMLVELEFDEKHITSGYTVKAYGGKGKCFVSKGQGAKYYKLLHSESKKDLKLFLEMVERDIEVPVKKFLQSVKDKLQSLLSQQLFKAIEDNDHSEVEDCIKRGALVNSNNTNGGTPLHYAVNNGNIHIVLILLENAAYPTQVTTKGNTPLHIATSKGYKEIVNVLLQYAIIFELNDLINAQTTQGGTTSLHVAAKNGYLEIVKLLLKHGAIYNIENKEGKIPLDLSHDQNIINLLKITDELFKGAENGNVQIISQLQHTEPDDFSALTNARNNHGNTLLQVVITNKHKNIENKLIEMLKNHDRIHSSSSVNCSSDQLEKLIEAARRNLNFFLVFRPRWRDMSKSHHSDSDSEEDSSCRIRLKTGSYYLASAHHLVEIYKESIHDSIWDTNIQSVNDMLIALEFNPDHASPGCTGEADNEQAKGLVSKGQGTQYYKLLHSESRKNIRLFVDMVERNIHVPVKQFFVSVTVKLQSVLSQELFTAIENNNHSKVKDCITRGANVNSKNTNGGTPLHYAVNIGNINIVIILLDTGAHIAKVTTKGNTPLHIATSKGHKEIVDILLQWASNFGMNDLIDAQTTRGGTTSLHVAVKNGYVDIVKLLLRYGAIYNIENKEGKIPLDLSQDQNITYLLKLIEELFEGASHGNIEIISKLQHSEPVDCSTLTKVRNKQGNTLLQVAIINKYKNVQSKFVEIFQQPEKIKSLSRPKSKLEKFQMLKEVAELHIKISILYMLQLKSMSHPSYSENNYSQSITLMYGSCYLRNVHTLVETYKWCVNRSIDNSDIQAAYDTLIKLEFDPKHVTSYTDEVRYGEVESFVSKGQGAKYYNLLCSRSNKDIRLFVEIVECNIEAPVKKFLESIEQKLQCVVPEKLFEIVENNNHCEIEDCIKEGVFVDSKTIDGRTPLHYAVHNGNIDIINVLLKNGADATHVTTKGNTPLHIATSKGDKEIVEVLLQHVSRDKLKDFINAPAVGGITSLHVAAKSGSWEIVKSLLKYGAIYNIKNTAGKTPLAVSQDRNIINLLQLTSELFQDAENGNLGIISKLQRTEPDEFIALTNARNTQGNTLRQVLVTNKHASVASQFLKLFKKPDQIQSPPNPKWRLDQIEKLKAAAELYFQCSQSYLPMLRNSSQPNRSEKNSFPWATLKAGSYYLQNVHSLVEVYKECINGSMDDKNIHAVNDILVELEFDPKHITLGYTEEAYDGKVECFVSLGQGTKYYELLHSGLKKDIRIFVELVDPNIEIYVKRFLESINQKFQSILSEMLFEAIENNNNLEVRNCIREKQVANFKTADGRTPLHHAVNNGNLGIINVLLKNGADVTQIANKGDTVLHVASSKGQKRIVEVLLQHVGAYKLKDFINASTTIGGNTALHIAAKSGSLEIVESLLKYGAIYNMKNKEGKTALDLSKDDNVTNLLKLIESLFEDARSGNLRNIRKLKTQPFKYTAITNTRNDEGKSLIELAISKKHQGLADKLLMILKK